VVFEHCFGFLVEFGFQLLDLLFRVEHKLARIQVEFKRDAFSAEYAYIRIFCDDKVTLFGFVHLGQLRVGLIRRDELLNLFVNQLFDEICNVSVRYI